MDTVKIAYQREMFRQYNRARAKGVDRRRLNKALGLLMSRQTYCAKVSQYRTTYSSCQCPDYENRTTLCKHRLAFVINWRAIQHVAELVAEGSVEFGDDPLAF
jgi:hypothetical protein